MPSLPRIKRPRSRTRAEEPVATPLAASRLSSPPTASSGSTSTRPEREVSTSARGAVRLASRSTVEDVHSKRQRPKIDEYPDYLFGVLHFPFYDKAVQRLNAAELDFFLGPRLPRHAADGRAPARDAGSSCAAYDDAELRESLFSKGSGLPAVPRARRPVRLLLPDPRQDRLQARLDRGRHVRGPLEEVVRDISNVKQEIISYRKIIKPAASPRCDCSSGSVERFLPEELELYFDDLVDAAERIWDLLDNYKEVVEALETTNESGASRTGSERRPADPHGLQHRVPAAADADREPLGHERRATRAAAIRRPPRPWTSGSSSQPLSPSSQACSLSSAPSAGSERTAQRQVDECA